MSDQRQPPKLHRRGRGKPPGGSSAEIDLGLTLLSRRCRPGVGLTYEDIAAWCDCHYRSIQQIEKNALRKIRPLLAGIFAEVTGQPVEKTRTE